MNKLKYTMVVCLFGLCVSAAAVAEDISAVVAWSQKVELGTLVSGVVSEVHVRQGQTVSKGDELITLDDRGFSSQLGRRLAAYEYARAALEEAKREDERAIELYDRTVLSDFERNQALIALHSARAGAEAARADLIKARLDLERSVVRAPFDGVVLAVNVAPGQTIVSEWQSQPLVTVADNRVYRARAEIDAAHAEKLEQGGALRATVRREAVQATVVYVGFEPVAQSQQGPRYELLVEIPAGEDLLRVGEMVILHME